MSANLEILGVATGLEKSVFISIPKKDSAKFFSNYQTIALKILQARLQQYMNHELPDVQAGFRKGRGTRDEISSICWITEKAMEFQKNIYFCFIVCTKAFDCMDHNCGKFLKRWEDYTTLPVSWDTCILVKKQQLELEVEQWTDS